MNNDPGLQWKFAAGLGDAIAIFLHTGLMGKFIHKVLKLKAPCETCQMRRQALNILFPIPFWRLFFKNFRDYQEALTNHLLQELPDHVIIEKDQKIEIAHSKPLYNMEHIIHVPDSGESIKCIFSVWTADQKEILEKESPNIIYFHDQPGSWITVKFNIQKNG